MKNLIIFIPLFFSNEFSTPSNIINSVLLFVIFSLFTGATYIYNDLNDYQKDRKHPKKSLRPIAAGLLNKHLALAGAIVLTVSTLISVYLLFSNDVLFLVILYAMNTILYTLFVKSIVILDVFSIGIGFVIRGLLGTAIINVAVSERLLIMLFFGALFLGFLKRYQEIKLGISHTRSTITEYNEEFLKQIIGMITTILIVAYTFYTFNSVQPTIMIITLPVVAFGIIRYYYNIFFLNKFTHSIEDIILGDKQILLSLFLYCCLLGAIITW